MYGRLQRQPDSAAELRQLSRSKCAFFHHFGVTAHALNPGQSRRRFGDDPARTAPVFMATAERAAENDAPLGDNSATECHPPADDRRKS